MFIKLQPDFWQVTNHLRNKRWPSLYSQWKVRADVGSHNKQQLTVQRARKAVAVNSVEEDNTRSFASEGQRAEKPEPTQ